MAGVWRVLAFTEDDDCVMSPVLLRVRRRGSPPTHLGSGPVSGYGVTFLRRKTVWWVRAFAGDGGYVMLLRSPIGVGDDACVVGDDGEWASGTVDMSGTR